MSVEPVSCAVLRSILPRPKGPSEVESIRLKAFKAHASRPLRGATARPTVAGGQVLDASDRVDSGSLDRHGHPHPAAHAHGGDPAAQSTVLERVQQSHHHPSAAAA